MAFISRTLLLSRALLSSSRTKHSVPIALSSRFSTTSTTTTTTTTLSGTESEREDSNNGTTSDSGQPDSSSSSGPNSSRFTSYRPLENGLDPGVYKAIVVGIVGQRPVEKHLKNGMALVLFSIGSGGIRNNRRPLDNEEPREYAERCSVQWHRVCVYPQRLASLALKHIKPGSILYLEGNLETKVFSDPITGLVRRIREVAVRRDGRLVFLGQDSEAVPSEQDLRNVGYF